jgi:hypothetical protein
MDEIDDANLRILGEQRCVVIGVVAIVKNSRDKGRNENMKLATQAGRRVISGEGHRDL